MRRLKRIVLISTLLLLVIVGGLLATAHFYKDEIIAKVLAVVNEKVDVPIAVSAVDFSLIHDFPNGSILFEDVFIADRFDEKDTLLQSHLLTLEFDIWDMVKGNYTIEKIGLGKSRLKMRTLADGSVNFIFWKKSDTPDLEMTFAIDRLEIADTYFTYQDEQAALDISSQVKHAEMKAKFANGWMDMYVDLAGDNTMVQVAGLHYLEGNNVAIETKMSVNEAGKDIIFEECIAEVGKVKAPLTGRIFKEEEWSLDLQLDGSLEIAELLAELPKDQKGNLDAYQPSGKVDFLLSVKGESSEVEHPAVDLAFDLRAGEVHVSDPSSTIRKISSKGRYTRDSKGVDKIQFAHFEGKVPQGQIAYSGLISDFDHPYVIGKFACEADFANLIALAKQDMMTSPTGKVEVDLDVRGHLPVRGLDISSKKRLTLSGEAVLTDLGFKLAGNGYSCADINTSLQLKDDRLKFDALDLTINGDPLEVSGHIDGLWPFVLSDGNMWLSASVRAEQIHWDQWASAANGASDANATLSKKLTINSDFEIDRFTYSSFIADAVTGHFSMKGAEIKVDPIHFESCEGNLDAQLRFAQREDLYWTSTCEAKIKGVDIEELFRQFDQFGQDFLTNKHLAGNGDASIHFEAVFDPLMNVQLQTLVTDADLRIVDGELIEHPAMQDIVEAIREKNLVQAFVRTDELEGQLAHLKFNTLENKIKIANEVIYIPEMLISSNAMDISIAGEHRFDNQIDYTMTFNLRDVLVNKSQQDFYIEDDGLGHVIPMRMYGSADDPSVSLDKDRVKENRKEAIAEAKSDLRDFFSDPFAGTNTSTEADDRSAVKVLMEDTKSEKDKKSTLSKTTKEKTSKKKGWKLIKDEPEGLDIVEDDEDDF